MFLFGILFNFLFLLVRYHLGTIAFGALLLAIIKYIRLLLEYVDEKLKRKTNPVVDFILKYDRASVVMSLPACSNLQCFPF